MSVPVIKEVDIEATMRDGTVLRADVYRPNVGGRFPTLLHRTPYNKAGRDEVGNQLAERGYGVVMQDVRGRYASDGAFCPGFFSADHRDSEDGFDTVEWAAQLPWSTGKVGTFGNSYCGWTQWELAHTRPPHLVAMMAGGIAANLLDRELSGVLRMGRVMDWTVNNLSVDMARRLGDLRKPNTTDEARRLWDERDRSKWLWFLPLWEIPEEAMPGMRTHWRRWLGDHTSDHFGFLEKHRRVNVPVLSTTGWYDQQIGTIKHFTGMVKSGMNEHARKNQYLIVGPWTHTMNEYVSQVGEVDFGPEACRNFYEIADVWFSRWLKGEETRAADWPPIQLFVMGANTWRGEVAWPLARTVYTEFYFHSGGKANSPAGDGIISQQPPQEESPDRYTYDPRDPVMSLYTPGGQHEPIDQRALDGRQDILVYSTPPLAAPVEVTGPVVVKLWASSSARDTDFVAKLIDVHPNGFAQELCYGIVRARYRESFDEPSLIEPGRVYEYTIQVNPTSNLFKRGHRIRMDISSSDFPNFDRNHNTGGDDYKEAALQTAQQTVYHERSRPSRVILPVIPG